MKNPNEKVYFYSFVTNKKIKELKGFEGTKAVTLCIQKKYLKNREYCDTLSQEVFTNLIDSLYPDIREEQLKTYLKTNNLYAL